MTTANSLKLVEKDLDIDKTLLQNNIGTKSSIIRPAVGIGS